VRTLNTADSASLLEDLASDHRDLERIDQHAERTLGESQTRLQMIEATASRNLDQAELS